MADRASWLVQWSNFRGYERSPTIEFPSITLLIGRNNVGKTSAYSPLLLLRQTLDAQNEDTALLFRGDLVDFGSYRDVVTDHDISKLLSFRLTLGTATASRRTARTDAGADIAGLHLRFRPSEVHGADLIESTVFDTENNPVIRRTRKSGNAFNVTSRLLPLNKDVGRPTREVTELRRSMNDEAPEGFLFSGIAGLLLPSAWRSDADRWEKVQGWYRAASEIFDAYQRVNSQVRSSLKGISFIGPLRSPPKRAYLVSAEQPSTVGRDGEWAAEVLYHLSQSGDSDEFDTINRWLIRMGYGSLEFESQGDYFRASVRRDGSTVAVNLADCGMGLAQLLPILVQGSVMATDGALIVQQPEIHLNPAQQDHLTDFLLEVADSGRKVIVETHSEHVLARLRRRVAEGTWIDSDEVAVYFCDSNDDRSSIRRIKVGKLGEIDDSEWPQGFFNEQLENSIGLAMSQLNRRKAVYG